MYLNLLHAIGGDKEIDHPVMGQISCLSLQATYKNCLNYVSGAVQQSKQCRIYYELSSQCFKSKNQQEFQTFVDQFVEERRQLIKFLRANQSKIPDMQKENNQSLFNIYQQIDEQEEQINSNIQNFYQKIPLIVQYLFKKNYFQNILKLPDQIYPENSKFINYYIQKLYFIEKIMGNKNSLSFEYYEFQQLVQQQKQLKINTQQKHLQEYHCMLVNHNNKSIEGICLNENCKQQNRRTCFDCILDKLHENEQKVSLVKNADQVEQIIQEVLVYMNQQLDILQFQFYFEQLDFCDESDQNLAFIKFQELNILEEQIRQTQKKFAELNFQSYLQEQSKTNIGLFQYLKEYQKDILKINNQIIEYRKIKFDAKQSTRVTKYVDFYALIQFQVEINVQQNMQAMRKKKIFIIQYILQTNQFKIGNLKYDQKEYLIKNIEEFNNLIECNEQLIENFKLLVLLYPKDPNFYNSKGDALYQIQKYEQAVLMYNQAIELNQKNADYWRNLGYTHYQLKQYEQALVYIDKSIELNPNNADYHFIKGDILLQQQLYEEAIIKYDQAIKINPYKPVFYNNKGNNINKDIGNSLYYLLKYEQALQIHIAALKKQFKGYYIVSTVGYIGSMLYKKQSSIQTIQYDQALALEPLEDDYKDQKQNKQDNIVDEATKINLQDAIYKNNQGLAFYKIQKYKEAIILFDQAIFSYPKDATYFLNKGMVLFLHLGNSHYNIQEYEQAINMYDQTILINPKSFVYFQKGLALRQMQKYQAAVKEFDQAIQINPQNPNYYFCKGIIYVIKGNALFQMQNYLEAFEIYKQATQLDPKNSDYYFYMGLTLYLVENYDKAIIMFDKAIELNSKNADYYNNKGIQDT
ncbi:hypothetical protein pb186bvf_001477 [Paramecium bursaria]